MFIVYILLYYPLRSFTTMFLVNTNPKCDAMSWGGHSSQRGCHPF